MRAVVAIGAQGLSPCGESGLKSLVWDVVEQVELSLPMRGEWIEMAPISPPCMRSPSLPMRGEWIEIVGGVVLTARRRSLPMRGEWIEIAHLRPASRQGAVSPHAGRVD